SSGGYLVVFASGKDRRSTTPGSRLHTNFKLSASGEYLGLYHLTATSNAVSELYFPEQRNNYSFGFDTQGNWVYFGNPTPGAANGDSSIIGSVAAVEFGILSGVFNSPLTLQLGTSTSGAVIRYTTDGSEPSSDNGDTYTSPLILKSTTILRAAAFKPNFLSSPVGSRTYLF